MKEQVSDKLVGPEIFRFKIMQPEDIRDIYPEGILQGYGGNVTKYIDDQKVFNYRGK